MYILSEHYLCSITIMCFGFVLNIMGVRDFFLISYKYKLKIYFLFYKDCPKICFDNVLKICY